MGNNRPVKTKCFIKYLLHLGCEKKGVKASHHKYKCPNCQRPIIIREADKEIPPMHVRSCAKTLGVSVQTIYDWIEKNC